MREVVDVLGRAREVHELADVRHAGDAGEPLLEPVFDRLDVVVGAALDFLDARSVVGRERRADGVERTARRRVERGDLGDAGLVGQRDEPRDLDAHALADQRELAEVLAQRRNLRLVASVERRQREDRGM